jgi:hypothetical protein
MSQVQAHTDSEPRRAAFHGSTVDPDETPAAVVGLFTRAKDLAVNLPQTIRTNIQERPVATLGVFTAIGVGAGVLFGSRILRSVLITALGQTAIELGREYIRKQGVAS